MPKKQQGIKRHSPTDYLKCLELSLGLLCDVWLLSRGALVCFQWHAPFLWLQGSPCLQHWLTIGRTYLAVTPLSTEIPAVHVWFAIARASSKFFKLNLFLKEKNKEQRIHKTSHLKLKKCKEKRRNQHFQAWEALSKIGNCSLKIWRIACDSSFDCLILLLFVANSH